MEAGVPICAREANDLAGACLYPQYHATNANVRTRRAMLRAVAGNHASSLPAQAEERADRARSPREPASLALVPTGWRRASRYRRGVRFKRTGVGQPDPVKACRRVRVAYDLPAGQIAGHQYWPRVFGQILGLEGPLGDEISKIQPCRHHVFAEARRRNDVRRIPVPAVAPREGTARAPTIRAATRAG